MSNIAHSGSKGRLLIVDDDKTILELWSFPLRLLGYVTLSAQSVAEAKTRLKETSVDLVITDWQLLDGIGDQVCQATRQINPAIPIIVISGLSGDHVKDITSCTPDAYFVKPVQVRTLVETIERLLATRRAGKSV